MTLASPFNDHLDDVLPLASDGWRAPGWGENACHACGAAAPFSEGPPRRPANAIRHYCRRCLPAGWLPERRA